MSESPQDKLSRLKTEYLAAKQALDFKKMIGDKRDEIEKSIEELKQDIENGTFKLYRKEKSSEEDLRELADNIETNTELLKSVTKTRRELDSKLDEFELFSTEMLFHLRQGIIDAILEIHPEKNSEYEELSNTHQELQYLSEYAKEIEISVTQVVELLSTIAQERGSVKKGGIFRYLFGANPNYVITKSLKLIGTLTAATIPLFNELTEKSAFPKHFEKLIKECNSIFKHLQIQAEGRWGWGKIDKEVVPFLDQLIGLSSGIKAMTSDLEAQAGDLKSQIDEWIERNTTI